MQIKIKLHLCFTVLFLSASLAFSQWIQQGGDIDRETAGNNSASISLSSSGTIVPLTQLAESVYFVKIYLSNNERVIKKIIIYRG